MCAKSLLVWSDLRLVDYYFKQLLSVVAVTEHLYNNTQILSMCLSIIAVDV